MSLKYSLAFICVFVAAAVTAQSAWAVTGRVSSTLPSVGNYRTRMPSLTKQNFDLARAGFSSHFNLGCDGVPQYGMVKNVGGEVQRVFTYLQKNAMGLAINYMVYQNPTLYSFLQNLNQKFSFLSGQELASCKSIRNRATNDRHAQETANRAVNECLANGNTPSHCNLGSNLNADAQSVQRDRQAARDRLTGKQHSSVTDVVVASLTPGSRDATLASGVKFKDLVESMIPQSELSGGSSAAGSSVRPADKTMNDFVIKAATAYAKLYDGAVDAGAKGTLATNRDYKKLMADANVPNISSQRIQELYNMRQREPDHYNQVIAALSRQTAINSANHVLNKYLVAKNNAQVTVSDDAVSADDWKRQKRAVLALRAQLNMIEADNHSGSKILTMLDSLLNQR